MWSIAPRSEPAALVEAARPTSRAPLRLAAQAAADLLTTALGSEHAEIAQELPPAETPPL